MDPNTPVPPVNNNPQPAEQPAPAAPNAKQQIVDYVNNGKNVLVTVGSDPSVDELASVLGLTFLLNKLGKHATAVFSGAIPSAMEFLDPEATFENSVDSLRDFIIALDKEKADKLRYKVEDDVVKIFITPYKTTISQKDLQFSQGDYNVDVVIALGATKREELDKAITSHGRILHDAVVITINAGAEISNLGVVDWNDPAASSVAEMLVSITEAFGSGLLDEQTSTAFLTGIVAETNRFSNEKTTPKVMTMSAQLMAAGANQQLIATNLRQEGMITEPVRKKQPSSHDDGGEMSVEHEGDTPEKVEKASEQSGGTNDKSQTGKLGSSKPSKPPRPSEKKDNSPRSSSPEDAAGQRPSNQPNSVDRTNPPTQATPVEGLAPAKESTSAPSAAKSAVPPPPSGSQPAAENVLPALPSSPQTPAGVPPAPPAAVSDQPTLSAADKPLPAITPLPAPAGTTKPAFGGTLNATTAAAEETQAQQATQEASSGGVALEHQTTPGNAAADTPNVDSAREAVEAATAAQPFDPANQPLQAIRAQPLPQTPDAPIDSGVSQLQSAAPTPAQAEPSPVDAFMASHAEAAVTPTPSPTAPSRPPGSPPPLPPLPSASDSGLPPLPPLPDSGQPPDLSAPLQPQINPSFMQDTPQSANPWSSAANDLSAQKQQAGEQRQAKIDQLGQQYDSAADKNRELQGKPLLGPEPTDHTTFPLPPPPSA